MCSHIILTTSVILSSVLYWSTLQAVSCEHNVIIPSEGYERLGQHESAARHYFWNTVTGDVQWDDPGDVPFETASGLLYWVGKDGQQEYSDKEALQYTWVEGWSEQYERPFFYNQDTGESVWDRPPDLAWRRVSVPEEL
ncbi:hypothetical protein COCSUDRAFT_54774 [Coccomyxa subellipsoidea C-169]|uniref:WW domain-containing protein n=1 Tax=Coccomyxa subellipsoidea (strain C-169) TaxID=574566 RepID=I0YLD8_COCSC|nr:hypothetical protein COCSUDRAFT_54774 [Coccomyxa subellipsoidea C-169]EIE19207.1 hypothetical protein COCSUDRAFT_54774 [Coccomyxa subellipsoidea C-169]|eukprot:XP_005643751.1 hypothetical protein COCSUDRAFT_54774 [Coccomyxa subellipsoidea C-169]